MSDRTLAWLSVLVMTAGTVLAQEKKKEESPDALGSAVSGLELRGIGPAMMSGRISDMAIHPTRRSTWYVTAASGGVWKTINAGTTWKPIFDGEGSYSIGCVALDQRDPLTVWVGTGENNSQRSVGYGDGVYKSTDGGATWKRVGLENSEHIGQIVIDPRDSDVVYVAAQGPLWKSGGDRGLYKTTDGGTTWKRILFVDEHTGANEILLDPLDPDVLLVSTYQRRRHVWTLINGGPGSAIYRSEDAGATFKKVTRGLPKVDLGRIGMARSPADPDVVYAIVEAQDGKGGFFRSRDGGRSWKRRSKYMSTSPQYYNELVADPVRVDRVYSLDTYLHRSDDGGKTWTRYSERTKHVDNHALWIDPDDTDHLIAGCDGGVYESWDLGTTWLFKANLPLTQFYKATPDNAEPFYNVYGGTQDNATQGGPSRTLNRRGVINQDWWLTVFGDGFKTQIDPKDPQIVYSQWQYGGLVRHDRRNGENIDIQPQPAPGDEAPKWNWDSALIISPHLHTRLYFASQKVFRSDDRGNSWKAVSPDLTTRVDRNKLEVMGRVWSVDAVSKNRSTSFYGTIVSLSESPLAEGLLYAGTDDGLVQVTEDGGGAWRKAGAPPGVPEMSYVGAIVASSHDRDTVYAAFNDHKRGNFKPYVLRSRDRGASWTSIAANLPERGSVYAIAEDHVNPDLLFVGTEFGLWATVDGGGSWHRLKKGLPTIAVRDLEIQRRENDLVVGTFGRGIYILDDYTPLRSLTRKTVEKEAVLFPVRTALAYVEKSDLDTRFQGDGLWSAPNPPFGAVLTYHLKDGYKSHREARREREKAAAAKGEDVHYPSFEELEAEDREEKPAVLVTITDAEGRTVARVKGPTSAGLHRVAWNLRHSPAVPVRLDEPEQAPWSRGTVGPLVPPGRYFASLAVRVRGVERPLVEKTPIEVKALGLGRFTAKDPEALWKFQQRVATMQRRVLGARRSIDESMNRIRHVVKALDLTPGAPAELRDRAAEMKRRLQDARRVLSGDSTRSSRSEPTPPSIVQRVTRIVGSQWWSTAAPTETSRVSLGHAEKLFEPVRQELETVRTVLMKVEENLEKIGAPWTPGRVPKRP